MSDDLALADGGKAMRKRDDDVDPQTKMRLINPLAYTHSWPPFGNCNECGKAGAPYVGFDCGPGVYFCDDYTAEMLSTEVEIP